MQRDLDDDDLNVKVSYFLEDYGWNYSKLTEVLPVHIGQRIISILARKAGLMLLVGQILSQGNFSLNRHIDRHSIMRHLNGDRSSLGISEFHPKSLNFLWL